MLDLEVKIVFLRFGTELDLFGLDRCLFFLGFLKLFLLFVTELV